MVRRSPQAVGGLRLKLILPPLLVLFVLIGALTALSLRFVHDLSAGAARTYGQAVARSLAAHPALLGALSEEREEAIDPFLAHALRSDPLLLYLGLRTGKGRHLMLQSDSHGQRLRDRAQLLWSINESVGASALRSPAEVDMVVIRQPIALRAEAERAPHGPDLFVAVSITRHGAEHQAGITLILTLGGMAVALYTLLMLYFVGGVGRRLAQLTQGARRIEEGDLQSRVGLTAHDELGEVGRAFDAATERLARVLGQIRQLTSDFSHAASDVAEATHSVRRASLTHISDTEDLSQAARELVSGLQAGLKQTEALHDEAKLCAGIAARLASMSQEASSTTEEAQRVLQSHAEGVGQMTSLAAGVLQHAGMLDDSANKTMAAMLEVKQAISRVRETALSTADLAEHAGIDAERGTLVLADSVAGIEHIRDASRAVGQVTDDLQRRVGEIGDVLRLITELTQRTNLLALNASIIAAQAGAEGRGFAVVADEIKDLARRTANSAGNIDSLIQAVAEGAHAARRAALAGDEAVEAGVAQSKDAARTMSDILSRLRNWAQMANSIASATDDQARSAQAVGRFIQEVQAHIGEIIRGAQEQVRRGEQVGRQGTRLQEIIEAAHGFAQEQRESSSQIADTLERLLRQVDEAAQGERGRLGDGERLRGTIDILRRGAASQREVITSLERAASDLCAQVTVLGDLLGRLRT